MNQDTGLTASSGGAASETSDTGPSATLWTVERDITTTEHRALEGRPVPVSAPLRWVIGAVVGAVGLAALTSVTNGRIESELHGRTVASLRDAGLDPADFDIDFEFRDGTISGSLPDGWDDARFHAEVTVDGARRVVLEPARSLDSQER